MVDGKNSSSPSATRHPPPTTILLEKLPLFALTAAACLVTVVAQKEAMSTLERCPSRTG